MKILGIHGGFDLPHETAYARYNKDIHDSAAALWVDGEIVAVSEQERFDRIKHSNKFPIDAIKHCLDTAGIRLSEIDRIAMVNREETLAWQAMWVHFTQRQTCDFQTHAERICDLLQTGCGETIAPDRLSFVGHHRAHAMSGFAWSGFERALVVSLDGGGDTESGTISIAEQGEGLRLLRSYAIDKQSLGVFYQRVSFYLGFRPFSEFKVMGLAPYGDASVYRRFFEASYEIKPGGNYHVDPARLYPLLSIIRPRKPDDPIEQAHMDIAASLQEMTEKVVFSILKHYRQITGEANLVLTGGLAHNCALNGKLAYSKLFDRIYVQPAAHDGGTALGAALSASVDAKASRMTSNRAPHVFMGRKIYETAISSVLKRWHDFVTIEQIAEAKERAERVGGLLASGKVLGLAHGASEFGPRALGHRSIIADPRPPHMKALINDMVKKREAFRPFAPVVLEEDLATYFDPPPAEIDLRFMTYALRVRPGQREALGAVTHVDGTARVQIVTKSAEDEELRSILEAFCSLTGLPVLLNTSFNNNAEPIVDTAEDALVCFLTTQLDGLMLGDRLIFKKTITVEMLENLVLSVKPWITLEKSLIGGQGKFNENICTVGHQDSMPAAWEPIRQRVSTEIYSILSRADGKTKLGALLDELNIRGSLRKDVTDAVQDLWASRMIGLYAHPSADKL